MQPIFSAINDAHRSLELEPPALGSHFLARVRSGLGRQRRKNRAVRRGGLGCLEAVALPELGASPTSSREGSRVNELRSGKAPLPFAFVVNLKSRHDRRARCLSRGNGWPRLGANRTTESNSRATRF